MKSRAILTALLVLSLIFIVYGLVIGQNHSVFAKAVKICLECIGIG